MNEPEQERTQPSPTGGPPSMEQVLNLPERVDDDLYDLLGDLFSGPRGTWHRLWACLMTHWTFENDPLLDTVYVVPELRNELEQQLGRTMTAVEWAVLDAHAKSHAETVMKPIIAKIRAQ